MLKYWLAVPIIATIIVGGLWLSQYSTQDSSPAQTTQQQFDQADTESQPPAGPLPAKQSAPAAVSKPESSDGLDAPVAALQEINAIDRPFGQSLALYQLLDTMTADQVVGLIDAAASSLPNQHYMSATSIMFAKLTELDPERALQEAQGRASPAQMAWLTNIFSIWVRIDNVAARAAAERLSGFNRQAAQQAMARFDPEVVVQGTRGNVVIRAPFRHTNFEDAWGEALSLKDPTQRTRQLMVLAMQWASSDPQAAIQAGVGIEDQNIRNVVLGNSLGLWAQQDADSAEAWLLSRSEEERKALLQNAAGTLQDPDLALRLSRGLDGDVKQRVVRNAIRAFVGHSPDAAEAWVMQQAEQDIRNTGLNALVSHKVNGLNPQQALGWVDSLSSDDADVVRSRVFRRLVQAEPELIASRLGEVTDRKAQDSIANNVFQVLLARDIDDAIDFAQTTRFGTSRVMFQSMGQVWGKQDRAAALGFITTLSDTTQRDAGLVGVALSEPERDPADLLALISNPEMRSQIEQAHKRANNRK